MWINGLCQRTTTIGTFHASCTHKMAFAFLLGVVMKANVGGIDRILRIVVGIALIALAATGTVGVWGYIGIVPILTGFFKFCPAYLPFGINSCSKD
jgi:Protein of unknown function (DUF2892)